MSKLMRALMGLWFVCPIVPAERGGGEDGDAEGDEGDPEDEEEAQESEGDEEESGEEGEGAEGDSRAANIKALRRKAQAAQAAAQAEREARIAVEARLQAHQEGRRESPQEPDLPADADETQRFVHEGNRQLRKMAETVTAAQFEARDAADTARFYAKAGKDPTILEYEERVEKEVQKLRASGQFVPRAAIMQYLAGDDYLAAKRKKAASGGKQSAAAQEAARRVEKARGEAARPRSDKGGKEKASEADKRKERLRGIEI